MKRQAVNPYLPGWEYVPDGEPYLFGDRVYVYGSHDRFGAPIFCVNDYVCWSAPVNNLGDWKYEGIIYRKKQDPYNKYGLRCLYAPDVTRGPDGRYYLYYAFDFMGCMGVAVAENPQGPFEFYGHVKFRDGHEWGSRDGEPFPFDPGVLVDDDGSVYLYSGFATKVPFIASRGHHLTNEGGVLLELEPDMLTIKKGPELLFPTKGHKGAFPNHAFFEASSIRKVDGKYCFVYSSEHNHELCYALGKTPRGPFEFGGTLVDQGDLFLDDHVPDEKHALNYLGNTHGGLLELNGEWYIFYHRQTNRNSYCRQACAEHLQRKEDGGFYQAEVTSCGLNEGPLKGIGKYEARIACNLWSKDGTGRYDTWKRRFVFRSHPYFTQTGKDRECDSSQYIANMRDGATAGFKYFDQSIFEVRTISIEVRGNGNGEMLVGVEPEIKEPVAIVPINQEVCGREQFWITEELKKKMNEKGVPLYFRYQGDGMIDFISFELER